MLTVSQSSPELTKRDRRSLARASIRIGSPGNSVPLSDRGNTAEGLAGDVLEVTLSFDLFANRSLENTG
mgnify:CR=1 FL=1